MTTTLVLAEPSSGTDNLQRLGAGHHTDSLVIIPTYNEAENLKTLVPMVLARGPFSILVVDDASPDGTGDIADGLAACFTGRVDVIHRPAKLGLASAYLAGFSHAMDRGYNRIFQMDADFSHDPKALPLMRSALERADVVLGSRYVPGGGTKDWPLRRQVLSRGGSLYARLVLGLRYRDLTSGFKGFRRQVLEALDLSAIQSEGYAFQIEVTHLCHRMGFRVQEVPITFQDRQAGESKISRGIVAEAFTVVWKLRRSRAGRASVSHHRSSQRETRA